MNTTRDLTPARVRVRGDEYGVWDNTVWAGDARTATAKYSPLGWPTYSAEPARLNHGWGYVQAWTDRYRRADLERRRANPAWEERY